MFVVLTILIIFITYSKGCGPNDKHVNFPAKETQYELRPNIFIDSYNLLGKAARPHLHITFTYNNGPFGPSHWNKLFPKCAGKHQSPINIETSTLKKQTLPRLIWSEGYEKLPQKLSITNNGHTILLNAEFDNNLPQITGGPLGDRTYNLLQIHFHWSTSDHKGSEHTINKKSFAMEMHAVHYRSDLNSSSAVNTENGLCVIAYIFEVGDKCQDAISSMISHFERLKTDEDVPIELHNLFRMHDLLDKFDREYVTYQGSLTTPPCFESVIWIISPYTLTISKKQIENFRLVSTSGKGFGDNFRTTQPLNGRTINFIN